MTVWLRVHVYREGPVQGDAAEAALARCEAILSEIEDGIEADESLANIVSFLRVAEVTADLLPRDQGWTAVGRVRIAAENHP